MSPPGGFRSRQRGVALIIALILVSLATMLAWKVGYQGYLERRRSIGMLAAEQAVQFGMGAEALAADVLSRDMQMNKQTTLASPWAQATQPLPLTSQSDPDSEPIGYLQGSLEDMQGRFNLNNLGRTLANGQPDPVPLEQFQRLLQSLNLETKWAGLVRDWIDADNVPSIPDGAEDSVYTAQTPPYLTGNWPMTSPSELMALPGFDLDHYAKIAPYVTALPTANSAINLCTASALVIESLAPNLSGEYSGNLDALAIGRKSGCFPDINTFKATVGPKNLAQINGLYTDNSAYFRLTTHITLGTSEFTLYSLLLRGNGGKITPLLRNFGTL
ncbi:MAG TPA: type II secretion system minor pseudopilin GspK [Steroidobacteraceae bacterium]|nr:type II secretion system minor pseudopilin GspK [Steroidobacteraceae bacterium]